MKEAYERKMKFWRDLTAYIEKGEISRDLVIYLRRNQRILGNYNRKPIVMGWNGVTLPKEGILRDKLENLLSYASLFYSKEIDPNRVPENIGYIKEIRGRYIIIAYKENGKWKSKKVRDPSQLPANVKESIPKAYFLHELSKRKS